MLKQLPSRNQKTKGFKVKDALQICILVVICVWLLYQANKTYHKKFTLDSSGEIMANEAENGLKLGRKGLNPLLEDELAEAFKERDDDEEEDLEEEGKVKAKEANADDEMDGGDLPKTEEEEPELLDDLIDEDDGDKEEASKEVDNIELIELT